MAEEKVAQPFHSFAFTLVDRRSPRAALKMSVRDDGMYDLKIERGSAANPSTSVARVVPRESAERLRDALQEAGVFGWDDSYGDQTAPGTRRWTLSIVFRKDVFSLSSRGASDVPDGFDRMIDELRRFDFPQTGDAGTGAPARAGGSGLSGAPADPTAFAASSAGPLGFGSALNALGARGVGGMSAGDLGAYGAAGGIEGMLGAAGVDLSGLGDVLSSSELGGLGEFRDLLADAQANPQMLQARMRDEFKRMPPDEQERLIDALASSGLASRAWWERFLRG